MVSLTGKKRQRQKYASRRARGAQTQKAVGCMPTALVPNRANLFRSLLQLSLLEFLLALDAVAGPRHRFQPFGIDLFSAMDALAETAFANTAECVFYHLQQLALVVALVEEELLVVGVGGLVSDVLRGVLVRRTPILLRPRYGLAQLLLPLFQTLFERVESLFVHGHTHLLPQIKLLSTRERAEAKQK